MTRFARKSVVALSLVVAASCGGGEAAPHEDPSTTEEPDAASPTATVDPTIPHARAYSLMADAPGDMILVYGGQYGIPPGTGLSDVWAFGRDAGWRELDPGPEGVHGGDGFLLETDSTLVVIVEAARTRILDPRTGELRTLMTDRHPTNVWGTRFVYDVRSDLVIGFGGLDGSSLYDDTWALDVDAKTWTHMEPKERPPAENFHAMAYDPGTDRAIMFNRFGQTWSYDVDTDSWTDLEPRTSPAARTYSAMVYDPATKRIILFGGVTEGSEEPFGDTWTYDPRANEWAELEPATAPSPRGWHSMATDAETGAIFLFSGGETRDTDRADLWRFDPMAEEWSEVS